LIAPSSIETVRPEPAVIALGQDAHVLIVERVDIGGMRVQAGQHPLDRALDQRLVVDPLDIVRLHPVEDLDEAVELSAVSPSTDATAPVATGTSASAQRAAKEASGRRDMGGILMGLVPI
jgi:hypothetical protein